MKNQTAINLALVAGMSFFVTLQGFAAEATGSISTTGTVTQVITALDLPTVATISGTTTSATSLVINSGSSVAFNPTGNVRVTIPESTIITPSNSGVFDTTAIVASSVNVTSGLSPNQVSVGAVNFGTPTVGLNFSRPVRIDIPVTVSSSILIRVRHTGYSTFGTTGLTNNPSATCVGGIPSVGSDAPSISAGVATIYTCSASTFVAVQTSTPTNTTVVGPGGGGGSSPTFTSILNTPIDYQEEREVDTFVINFNDITGNWSRTYIEKLAREGIITNGTKYYPDRNITRAEFVKMIVNSMGIDLSVGNDFPGFSDVSSRHSLSQYISAAAVMGLINSDTQVFRPDATITRAEAMKILVLALDVEIPTDITQISFADVNPTSSLAQYIETSKRLNIVSGQYVSGRLVFRPDDSITRAEIAKILVNGFGL